VNFEEQIYLAALQQGDICFDVGANVGSVATFFARIVTPSGCVIAFEPIFAVYRNLCKQVQDDPYMKAPIIALPVGLSDVSGSGTISVPDGDSGLGSLASSDIWRTIHAAGTVTTHVCDFTTLDSVLADERYPRPDFIKIDVEGAELRVLRGGLDAFQRGFRPLMLIELFAPWQRAFGYGPWDVLGFLANLGYQFYFACPEGLVAHVPSASKPFPRQYERGYNLIAYRPEEHARRVERLNRLMSGGDGVLSMAPPPVPNKITFQ
jgi:FkbM family methyltransferase